MLQINDLREHQKPKRFGDLLPGEPFYDSGLYIKCQDSWAYCVNTYKVEQFECDVLVTPCDIDITIHIRN